jgi:MFS family permease
MVVRRWGYLVPLRAASVLLVSSLALLALAPDQMSVVVSAALLGLAIGLIFPTLAALIGLAAPRAVRGTMFGVAGSAVALGFMVGPLLAGTISALLSTAAGFVVTAAVAGALAVAAFGAIREPATRTLTPSKA